MSDATDQSHRSFVQRSRPGEECPSCQVVEWSRWSGFVDAVVYACLDCGDLEHEFAAIHSILGDPRDSFAAPDVFGDNLFYERGYFLSEFQVRSIGELTGLFMIYGFGFAAMLSGPGGRCSLWFAKTL